MSVSSLLDLIEKAIGQRPGLSPESHLPLDLHLQRFMVPPHDDKARYHAEGDKIVALNLSGLGLQAEQLSFLAELSHLKALNLSNNALSSFQIPKNLSGLEYLELSDHKALVSVIFPLAFPHLKRLNLSNSGIETLTLEQGFRALEIVELQKNKLKELHLPAGFDSLIFIDLKDNQIASFKAEGSFPKLYTLYLENNDLKEIRKDFLEPYPNLGRLRLEGNPLHESILANISENSTETLAAIRRYITDLDGGTDIDKECKVLLLGNGSVGKSTLVKRMVHDKFIKDWNSTHGISLEQYPNPEKENPGDELIDPYILNLWDFGGQDIYHATHRLFMQSNAVYLVLWDKDNLKKDKTYLIEDGEERSYENHSLQYWLSYAISQGKDSPALLVQTKSGEDLGGKMNLPKIREAFYKKFPLLKFEHIESKEDNWEQNGFEELLGDLKKAVKLIKAKADIPKYWSDIRSQIRELQKSGDKRLELQDFYALAEEVEEPLDVLRWLTQSGALFYKEGLFNDEIILDQAWAIEAIYTLFDRNNFYYRALQGAKGEFSGKDLIQIWKKEGKANSEAEMELFVSFMLSCEMCFETTPEDKERYHEPFANRTFIAPQLLPKKTESQDLIWQDKNPLHIRFEHEFLHYGVIQSFIVRAQKLGNTKAMWKTGIFLTEGKEMIQVEAWEKKVEIKASVSSPKLLALIRKELTELQDNEALETVSLDAEKYVEYKKLEEHINRGKNMEMECVQGGFVEIEPFRPYFQKLFGLKDGKDFPQELLGEERMSEPAIEIEKTVELPDTGLPRVYFSYAWGDSQEKGKSREDLVDALFNSLEKEKEKYHLLRDKKHVKFGDLISGFMNELGEGDLIIVFMSDKYLRSPYCMYELYEVGRNNNFDKELFSKHILPVRVEGGLDLDDPEALDLYYDHWEAEEKKWAAFVKKRIKRKNLNLSQSKRYQMTQDIQNKIGDLSDWLTDINASTHSLLSQNDYQMVRDAIEKRLNKNGKQGT